MRKVAYMLVIAVILCAAPALAQGPFTDVPTDHWAYDAVNTLQKDGIVIGYPDGTFGGKRAMSRYEFAVAVARVMEYIGGLPTGGGTTGNFVTQQQLEKALEPYAKKSEIPSTANFASKADVDAIRKLVDEFRDEIAALGVDVDALKRDVAALAARVDALEAMVKRVQFYGNLNTFVIANDDRGSSVLPSDLDQRLIGNDATLGRTVGVVTDFDLSVVGRVSDTVTANATINYGNYLNYVRYVDDYIDGTRPTNKSDVQAGKDFTSTFFPYYMYIDAGMGMGSLQAGRFPIQFTPYTLKKIDVDAYTSILKTDDGNYPMDGIKLNLGLFGLDWTFFAAKNDENDYLLNGLTGRPNAGLYDSNIDPRGFAFASGFVGGYLPGNAVGLLAAPITQTAGGRVMFGAPFGANIGLTYYQSWSSTAFNAAIPYDQARVFGADLAVPIGNFGLAGSWTQSDTLAADYSGVSDMTDNNTAWDAKLTGNFGKLGVGVGYKDIARNFSPAGAWDKIGRWTNPVDVKGPYADINYPITPKVSLVLNGEWLKLKDTIIPTGQAINRFGKFDDEIIKGEAGLKWGLSSSNSLDLGVQYVKFNPDTAGVDDAVETYYTVGWAHQLSANAGFKIGYQFINYDDGVGGAGGGNGGPGPYKGDYHGGLGVVQFGVSF